MIGLSPGFVFSSFVKCTCKDENEYGAVAGVFLVLMGGNLNILPKICCNAISSAHILTDWPGTRPKPLEWEGGALPPCLIVGTWDVHPH